ncbi:HTTM domain-containing protein [Flavobacterium litorale]|uniref:HTTM domain-containing protein n=1 Tax=Flavobacterium litorale TaxID=2856519 RepID=A0ABX8V916_9FLAO|nr:HTTM domain-containing protein [Flavobacterium litorale]QYJ69207.1 HTTM domain-containing protein [Flavobacterium litorale]
MKLDLKTYLNTTTKAAPLIVFRIGFGLMMFLSIIRFWAKGWIETLYIQPKFHFTYYGFEWVKPLGNYTYLLFIICGLAAFFVAIGYKYRLAIITFFLSFTYIELMDKTTYLNHYYFISIMSFMLIFLPANVSFSVDAYLKKKSYSYIPKWNIDAVKLLLGIVYVYAGLAKINSDWLGKAQPLKIWLPSKYDLPYIGENLMQQNWFHHAMSWSGMLYDLFIPFLLLYKKTRWVAFALVVFFHVFTRVLFPIGIFPYVMIVGSLIFFEAGFHEKVIAFLKRILQKFFNSKPKNSIVKEQYNYKYKNITIPVLVVFFTIQLLFPFRYSLYPDELFWTEEGYRFSWRVMLMEKMGYANFKIVDGTTKQSFYVNNTDFLTPFQEKQMSFQPDFILEYAHYLGDYYKNKGYQNVEVYVESYVALNGRLSQPFVDKTVNLYREKESFKHKDWILPFNDEIKGL